MLLCCHVSSLQAESLLAMPGQKKKIHAMAAMIRAAGFLERYDEYAQSREERHIKLKEHW